MNFNYYKYNRISNQVAKDTIEDTKKKRGEGGDGSKGDLEHLVRLATQRIKWNEAMIPLSEIITSHNITATNNRATTYPFTLTYSNINIYLLVSHLVISVMGIMIHIQKSIHK